MNNILLLCAALLAAPPKPADKKAVPVPAPAPAPAPVEFDEEAAKEAFESRALVLKAQAGGYRIDRNDAPLTEEELLAVNAPDISDFDPSAGKPAVSWMVPLALTPAILVVPTCCALTWCVGGTVIGGCVGGAVGVFVAVALQTPLAILLGFYGLYVGFASCFFPGAVAGLIATMLGGFISVLGGVGASVLKSQAAAAPPHPYVGFVYEYNSHLARELHLTKGELGKAYFPRE